MTDVTSGESRAASRRWWGLGIIALAQMMVVLDTTVVFIALPSAQRAVNLSVLDRQWVVTAYTLTFGGLLLLGGRLGDLFGRRRTLLIGVIGFAIASAAGGAAVNATMLISTRAAQGACAAMLAPSALALLSTIFTDPKERGRAFGAFSIALMTGGAFGQILGGALTQYLGWRWCFYVNVPIGAAVVVGAFLTLPNPPGRPGRKLDPFGVVLGCGGMVALIYALGEAGAKGWSSLWTLLPFAASAVLLVAFALAQARVVEPLLPLRLFADRNRTGAYLAVASATFGTLGMFLFMTFQLQSVMGYSPVRAGLSFMPYVVGAIIATRLVTRILPRFGPRLLVALGLLLVAVGLLVLTQDKLHSPYAEYILPGMLLCGLGMGGVFAPSMSTATTSADPRDAGVVAAVVNTSQQIGGSIGTALLNTIAAGGATAYVAAHHGLGSLRDLATVHGNAVACAWAAGVLLAVAILVVLLIKPVPPARAESPAEPAVAASTPRGSS